MTSRKLLALIIILGFVVRFYRFDNPIADWHSWRQADTSSVSRNFVKDGFDILHPKMDNISNVQSGIDNPEGYFFVEFPIYNAAQAVLYKFIGILSLEEWGRFISIISSMLTTLFLYLIVARHSNKSIGLFASFFYAFLPFNIYFGRTILSDTTAVMATLGGIYFFDLWIEKSAKYKVLSIKYLIFYILAIIFTITAFLLKPTAVFFVLPIIYLAFKHFGWDMFRKWQLWLFGFLILAPLVWWRTWMQQFPEGIPANTWLLNGNGIRFRPAFFRWIFYERLTILISGYLGTIIAIFGLFHLKKLKEWMFFVTFFLGSLLYISVFATGNVQHDYYQIPIMPSVAIILAIGSFHLWNYKNSIGKYLLIICVALGFYFSWDKVKDYFNINNRSIIIAGEAVDKLTPKDVKIIANYNGDSSFLYQTKRKGWASFQDPLPIMVEKGASFLVLVNPTKEDHVFAKDYKIVAETKEYIIFDLKIKP